MLVLLGFGCGVIAFYCISRGRYTGALAFFALCVTLSTIGIATGA